MKKNVIGSPDTLSACSRGSLNILIWPKRRPGLMTFLPDSWLSHASCSRSSFPSRGARSRRRRMRTRRGGGKLRDKLLTHIPGAIHEAQLTQTAPASTAVRQIEIPNSRRTTSRSPRRPCFASYPGWPIQYLAQE